MYIAADSAAVSGLTAAAQCILFYIYINSIKIHFVQLFDILKSSIIFPFHYLKILLIKVNPLICNLNIGLTKQWVRKYITIVKLKEVLSKKVLLVLGTKIRYSGYKALGFKLNCTWQDKFKSLTVVCNTCK